MNKAFRILEIVWLIVGGIGVIMCAYMITSGSTNDALFFLGFTVIAGIMYSVRKRQRQKFEAAQKEKEQQK